MTIGAAGSVNAVRVILKSWVLLGAADADRRAHMSPAWKPTLLDLYKNDCLLNEDMIDAMAVTDWTAAIISPVPCAAPPVGPAEGLLGEPMAGISAASHARMEKLAADGHIPITSTEQRRRHGRLHGSIVPEALREAVRLGYLHPNLPAPQGMQWECRGGVWGLALRGG